MVVIVVINAVQIRITTVDDWEDYLFDTEKC